MTGPIAALPMYDWPEVRGETDRLWAAIRDGLRARGVEAPERLARGDADLGLEAGAGGRLDLPALWRHPSLLLAQTCWGPMEGGLAERVTVVGQPDYSDVEGGEGELYSSAIVMRGEVGPAAVDARTVLELAPPLIRLPAPLRPSLCPRQSDPAFNRTGLRPREREEDSSIDHGALSPRLRGEMPGRAVRGGAVADISGLLRDRRFAFNSRDSMSGLLAMERDLAAVGEGLALFAETVETGSHRASIVAVAQGRADVCAVDCRTWALAERFEPAAKVLRVVGWTAKRKGLPFVTARRTPPEVVAALRSVLRDLPGPQQAGCGAEANPDRQRNSTP